VFVTNHVLAGAVIGQRFPGRPVTAFVVGMGSHLAMDAVPHWGCDVTVDGGWEQFLRAARRDGLVGLAACGGVFLAADRRCRVATVAAVAGAVLLDLDKPVEHFFGRNPFPELVQWVHGGIQRESPGGMPVEVATGALLALVDAVLAGRGRRRAARGRIRHEPAIQCSSAGQSRATLPS